MKRSLSLLIILICVAAYGQVDKTLTPYLAVSDSCFSIKGAVLVNSGQMNKAENYSSTDYISIKPGSLVEFVLPYSAGAGVVYFDSDKKVIGGYCSTLGGNYSEYAPEDAVYVRFSRRLEFNYSPNVRVFSKEQASLSNDVEQTLGYTSPNNTLYPYLAPDYHPVFSKLDYSGTASYRIPSHIRTKHGTVIVVTELRETLDDPSYAVGVARSTDNGMSFEHQQLNASYPCLLYDKVNDVVYIFSGLSYSKSTDDGKTWTNFTKAAIAPEGWPIVHVSSNNGIQLTNGILAVPVIFQTASSGDIEKNCSAILYSPDFGKSWKWTALTPEDIISNEFTIAEYEQNQIMINSRGGTEKEWNKANPGRRVFVPAKASSSARSSWSVTKWVTDVSDCTISEPICNASFISADSNGFHFGLFCNAQAEGYERKNLMLQVSSDFHNWSKFGLLTPFDMPVLGYCSLDYTDGCLSFVYEDTKLGILYADLTKYMDDIMQKVVINKLIYK